MMSRLHQKNYFDRGLWKRNLDFTSRVMEAVWNIEGPQAAKDKILRHLIWFMTESDGKWGTRFRSIAALKAESKEIRHDHVFPIKDLIALSKFCSDPAEAISFSVGCLVTREEHALLHSFDKHRDAPTGWDRYRRAGIRVKDMLNDTVVSPAKTKSEMKRFSEIKCRERFFGDSSDFDT